MARRAGKAATRRARHSGAPAPACRHPVPARRRRRPPPRRGRRRGHPDEPRGAASRSAPVVSRRSLAARTRPGSSLTDRERAEYHYVERDLRNIGILTAILFALLIAAWLVTSAIRGFG